jgi:hypothetical protein
MKAAVVTVASVSHWAHAELLMDSVGRHHPEVTRFIAAAERPGWTPESAVADVLNADRLGVPADVWRSVGWRHSPLGLASTMKAWVLAHLLLCGYDRVIYLDADTFVIGGLDPLLQAPPAAVHLTPHLLRPPCTGDAIDREMNIVLSGTFNAGVVMVDAGPTAERFLDWWNRRMVERCESAVGEGMFHDQRWLDLVRPMFGDLHVLRDEGLNVGHWNLAERPVWRDGTRWMAAGVPLRVFHFSGFDPYQPSRLSRFATSRWPEDTAVGQLLGEYADALIGAGWVQRRCTPWSFDCFDDGVPIPSWVKDLANRPGAWPGAQRGGDAWSVNSPGGLHRWLTERGVDGLSPLWRELLALRPDVDQAFTVDGHLHLAGLFEWARTFGRAEMGLDPRLVPQTA